MACLDLAGGRVPDFPLLYLESLFLRMSPKSPSSGQRRLKLLTPRTKCQCPGGPARRAVHSGCCRDSGEASSVLGGPPGPSSQGWGCGTAALAAPEGYRVLPFREGVENDQWFREELDYFSSGDEQTWQEVKS